ncbi:MAG: Panacea domain-containing protein [Methanobrevibacter sp.]|nr:Panacea domain-containing protein [Methanobrevibacter sp.]
MELNKEKMKEVIHYIIDKCGCKGNLWRTHLYKILYFSDFNFHEKYERSITNESYSKFERGPFPVHLINIKNEMISEGKIKEKEKLTFIGATHMGYNYSSCETPKIELLSDDEIQVIDQVINKLSNMNFNQINEYSHGDIAWIVAENEEIIDYRYVFYRTNEYSLENSNDTM